MKKTLSLIAGLFISVSLMAQEKIDIGANFNYALPLGNYAFGDQAGTTNLWPGNGMGGTVEFNYWFNRRFTGGVEVGYIQYMDDTQTIDDIPYTSSATSIPLAVKFDVFLNESRIVRPYFGLAAGYNLYTPLKTTSVTLPGATDPITTKTDWNQSGAFVSPRFGLNFIVTEKISINVNARYDYTFNKIDNKDHDVNFEIDGESDTQTITGMVADPASSIVISAGIKFTLFDYFGYF